LTKSSNETPKWIQPFIETILTINENIEAIETRLSIIEFYLGLPPYQQRPRINNQNRKWAEWSRKIILKLLEIIALVLLTLLGFKIGEKL